MKCGDEIERVAERYCHVCMASDVHVERLLRSTRYGRGALLGRVLSPTLCHQVVDHRLIQACLLQSSNLTTAFVMSSDTVPSSVEPPRPDRQLNNPGSFAADVQHVIPSDERIAVRPPQCPIDKLLALLQGDIHIAINALKLPFVHNATVQLYGNRHADD